MISPILKSTRPFKACGIMHPRCGRPVAWMRFHRDQKMHAKCVHTSRWCWRHFLILPQGRTVNKEYYLEVMQRLREAVRKKRPDAWRENRWMLQHDNVPSHSSFLVRDFLAKHATTVFPQPPYSADLAPADFFLFPKLKSTLKGRRLSLLRRSRQIR